MAQTIRTKSVTRSGSQNFNPFQRQYKYGKFQASENFGTNQLGGTNFLNQTLIPRTVFEVDALTNDHHMGRNPNEVKRFIRDHYPILKPYIEKKIEKGDWKKNLSPLQFLHDMVDAVGDDQFRTLLFLDDDRKATLYYFHEYQTNHEGYSIEFKPFLKLQKRHKKEWELWLGVCRLLMNKIPFFADERDLEICDMAEDWYENDELKPEDLAYQRKLIAEWRTGTIMKMRKSIKNCKLTKKQVVYRIKRLKENTDFQKRFKHMCETALELIEIKGDVWQFTNPLPKEFDDGCPVMPYDYCSVEWAVDDCCPVWHYKDNESNEAYNNYGFMPFRYTQNLTYAKKVKKTIPQFPNVCINFLKTAQVFMENHLYERKKGKR